MEFYAYLWLREDGTPYYVGKGCRYRAYSKQHTMHAPRDKSRIVILNRDSEQAAFETEKELISNWGRKDIGTGCLRNFTDGGEGASGIVFSEERKAKSRQLEWGLKRRGWKHSQEAKAQISAALMGNQRSRGRVLSEEHKAKIFAANTGRKPSVETRKKLSDAKLGKPYSEVRRQKFRLARIGKPRSEECRQKISLTLKGKPWSEARRQAQQLKHKEV